MFVEEKEVTMAQFELWDMLSKMKSENYKWVELNYSVDEQTPHYHFFEPLGRKVLMTIDKETINVEQYSVVSQYGTHVDPPYHFVQGGRTLDEITWKEMILPLCVIDVSAKVKEDNDYEFQVQDILDFEEKYGRIPEGCFVAMRSDWHIIGADDLNGTDADGVNHYPGWGIPALEFLVKERNVLAVGHESSDTDPAKNVIKQGWKAELYILEQDRYQIEFMVNLDKVPPMGSLIVCAWPDIKGGTGFTAKCLAICPK